jgi:hypothetical protein
MDNIMASINEVYGNNFREAASSDKANYAAKLYATNIAHKQFNFRNEAPEMWQGNNMKQSAIQVITTQPSTINNNLRVVHIPKTSKDINMFPYLINGPVEYFVVVDTEHMASGKTQIYSIYITSMKMEAY